MPRVCSFKDCSNSKSYFPHIRLFSYPRDEERCKMWLGNTGCPEKYAHLTTAQLSRRLEICALHFERSSFMNYLCRRLIPHAVPVAGFINQDLLPMLDKHKTLEEIEYIFLQQDLKLKEQQAVASKFVSCGPEPVVSGSADVSNLPVKDECDPLDIVRDVPTDRNKGVCADWKAVKCAVNTDQRGNLTRTELVDAASKYLSGPPLTLFRMQILRGGNDGAKVEWAVEEMELSLNMYYKSASLYKYMRDRQGFVLPSDTDIQHWINCTNNCS